MKQIYKLPFVLTLIMAITSIAADPAGIILNPADDNFLQISGIPGESADSRHKGEINILSWSFGVEKDSFREGGTSGSSTFKDFIIIKKFDKSSPTLFLVELSGQQIPEMVLTVRKTGEIQHEFLKVILEDVLVTDYETFESENGVIDQWSFNYGKIQIEYQEQNPDGSPVVSQRQVGI